MAVESTVGRKFTIDRLCMLAYQSVGLMSLEQGPGDASWPAKRVFAIDMLQILLNGVQAYGVQARLGGFADVTVSAAAVAAQTFKFDIPTTVLTVQNDGKWIDAAEDVDRASSETLVKAITRDQWHRIGSRSGTGTPTQMYVHRNADTQQAWLWPIPDAAGTLRLDVHRKLADVSDPNATVDVEDYWADYLIKALSGRLAEASALPPDVVMTRTMAAEQALTYARGKAGEGVITTIHYTHRTPWH